MKELLPAVGAYKPIQSLAVGAAMPLQVAVTVLPRGIGGGLSVSVGPAASLSIMVSTAVLGLPSVAPPVGLLRARLTVSFGSTLVSFTIGILTVLLAVSPLAKVTV